MADDKEKQKKNKDTLTVVVGGIPVEVTVNENAPLQTVVPEALRLSGNVGQSPDEWLLKDEPGNELDLNEKIEDYGFSDDTKLFLSPKAGTGG